jgi:hypothetical protein
MKTMKSIFSVAIVIILVAAFNSCEKNNLSDFEKGVLTSEEISASDGLFDDILEQAEIYEDASTKSGSDLGACEPTVTITYPEQTQFPRVVTIDFGTEGCTGFNEVVRKGKIIITVSSPFMETGSTRTITFENFSVNDFKVEGTKTVVFNGFNEAQNPTWSVEIIGQITSPEGKIIVHNASRTREWVEGYDTPRNFLDDVFSISGTASGINARGNNYSSEIASPLVKARNCRWIQAGIINIMCNDKNISIDFGNGTCDNKAIVTINGEEREIQLGRRF